MTGLLRAEWTRFRGRYDLWIVIVAALLLGAFSYISGAGSANSQASSMIDPSMPPDLQAQVAAMDAQVAAQMAAVRDLYVFPRSIVTILYQGNWLFMAAAFVAASWIATEFDWGTIRNALLVSPRRGRFLAARILALGAAVTVAVVALGVLGAILPLLVPVTGTGGPSGVTPAAVLLSALGDWTWCVAFLAVATLAALVTRSPILALILTYGYFVLEGVVDNLQLWTTSGPIVGWARQFLLGLRLVALSSDVRVATGLTWPYGDQPLPQAIHLEPIPGALVVVAWIGLLLGAAYLVFRRADIRE